jgi:intracellular sulfur oxidation DsrE/DsrF family protein
MLEPKLGTLRRDLLGAAMLGAAAALPELASADQVRAAPADNAFLAWLDSIGGKQRQLFDMPEPHDGFGLVWAKVFLDTGPAAFGLPESDFGAVIVLRHFALPLALDDAIWRKYKLGQVAQLTDPASKAPAERNYFVRSRPGDLFYVDASLDKLIARGVKVGACNVALTAMSGMLAKRMELPHDEVRKEWLAGLIPGVQLVPSGIVAVNGAQSRACAYCFAG